MKYLITGVAGSGKTVLTQELKKRDLLAIEIDTETDIAHSCNMTTGKYEAVPSPRPKDWRLNHRWYWDEPELTKFLQAQNNQDVILCGFADNQQNFYSLFDKILILTTSLQTLEHRLTTRKNNEFGKQKIELDETLERYSSELDTALKEGAIAIDNSGSIQDTADIVIGVINGS